LPQGPVIPYDQIDTIFLDVGNTLISIDFDWIAAELRARGFACEPAAVRRAEAAARPGYSQRLFVDGVEAGTDLFLMYLTAMFERLDVTAALPSSDLRDLVTELRPVLRPDGRASVLWRAVMPQVPEALARMRDRGLTLVVVSNSDGTAERSLEAAGLRPYLDFVIDSAIVGYEKPDPRIFEHGLRQTGARPERTLHVGDLYHADVTGARAAGIHAVLLDPYGDWTGIDCECAPDLWAVAERFRDKRVG
jgi:HAD superfamily hydrolase (TIGR01509 family)